MAEPTLEERVAACEAQLARWRAVEIPILNTLTTQIRQDVTAMKESMGKDAEIAKFKARRR